MPSHSYYVNSALIGDQYVDGKVDQVRMWLEHAFLAPGDWLLATLLADAPAIAAMLGIADADTGRTAAVVLAVVAWIAALLATVMAVRGVIRAVRALLEFLGALRIAVSARLHRAAAAIRRVLEWRPFRRTSPGVDVGADIAIGELDLAVLRTQSRLRPGYVLTAPEIANVIRVRPSQVESVLEKLAGLQLVEFAFGSLDGYDGYRITQAGRLYLDACGVRQAVPA